MRTLFSTILLISIGISFGCSDDTVPGSEGSGDMQAPDLSVTLPDRQPPVPDAGPRVPDQAPQPDQAPEPDIAVDMTPVDQAPPEEDMTLDMESTPVDMGGEEDAGPLMDTPPLSCEGDWCPSSRLSAIEIPANAQAALAGGCDLDATENGSAIGGLFALAPDFDLNQSVTQDASGNAPLLLVSHLSGWEAGQTGNEAGVVDLQFFSAAPGAGGLLLERVAFEENDPANPPRVSFPETSIEGAQLSTPPASFTIDLPLLPDVIIEIALTQASMTGDLGVDEVGFSVSNGVISGYLTADALFSLATRLLEICALPNAPQLCGQLAFLGDSPEAIVGLLVGILGGYDAELNGDEIAPCDDPFGNTCNAFGVCLLVDFEPTTVLGVVP